MYLCVRVRCACVQYPYGAWAWTDLPCLFVRASAVRMCTVPELDLGMAAYSLPGGVYRQNLYWACALHFRVCTCGTVFGLGSASSVSCMCVCVRRSACAARALYHSPCVRVCMRVLYSIWHGSLSGVRSIHESYLHVCTMREPLEQCLAWLVRAMYLSCSCLYCACIIAQCVLCLYPLYSVLAWPARGM